MHTFDTFIFDLDGTLLDTLPDLIVNTNTALEEEGYPTRSSDRIHGAVGGGLHSLIEQCLPENADEQAVERVMARWKALYTTIGTDLTEAYPGIGETLEYLSGKHAKLGVLSNKFDQGVKGLIGERFPQTFASVHGEGPTTPRKPDPTGLKKVIAELGSSPESTVYIGDSPVDVEVARRAGVCSVGVSWGYHGRKQLEIAHADKVIDHPCELKDLVAG